LRNGVCEKNWQLKTKQKDMETKTCGNFLERIKTKKKLDPWIFIGKLWTL